MSRGVSVEIYRSALLALSMALMACGSSGNSPEPGCPPASPAQITALTSAAYIWSLPIEFMYRFPHEQELISGPANTLVYGLNAAAWNNAASNAGNATVLYVSSIIDFTQNQGQPLVLTVPPSASQYYVVNLIDSFINGMGSIGTRTTPATSETSYLLVPPNSPYANDAKVTIDGHVFPVLASDTYVNDILIRIRADSLAPASDPTSLSQVAQNVVEHFALNPLSQFISNGFAPVFPPSFAPFVPTPAEAAEASELYGSVPTDPIDFFTQVGEGLATNPVPSTTTALSGNSVASLPAYVIPQAGATSSSTYVVPSAGQQDTLASFAPIGLTAAGWTLPTCWGSAEMAAFQAGFAAGKAALQKAAVAGTASASTNYWSYINNDIGTYLNTTAGYLIRGIVVLAGGFANIAPDAVYATNTSNNGSTSLLDGNNTYSITFQPPAASYTPEQLPAVGVVPPLALYPSGAQVGQPQGFWSIIVYQPDPSSSSAPFIPQTSVLNTSYSNPNNAQVLSITGGNTLTVAPTVGPILLSTPLVFGPTAAQYGLQPNTVYYVASNPVQSANGNYSFTVSTQWIQQLSPDGVPIQQAGSVGTGHPGAIATLVNSPSPSLTYGLDQEVSQLGSQQLTSGALAENADGSVTIWLAPTLPAGVPASNWIPTPSKAYYDSLYGSGSAVSTTIEAYIRMYDPQPGDKPPSILPDPTTGQSTTYVLPPIVQAP